MIVWCFCAFKLVLKKEMLRMRRLMRVIVESGSSPVLERSGVKLIGWWLKDIVSEEDVS